MPRTPSGEKKPRGDYSRINELYNEIQEEKSRTLGDVANDLRKDHADAIMRLGVMVMHSVNQDKPMSDEQVKSVWKDEFLTDVIVPFLDHVKNKLQEQWEETEDWLAQQADDEEVRSSQPSREFVERYHNQTNLRYNISSLGRASYILSEWRG